MKKLYLLITLLFVLNETISAVTININQSGFNFSPNGIIVPLTVNVGDVIHFVWTGGNHNTTSVSVPSGAATWAAPLNSSNQTFDYTVTAVGSYSYVCTFHLDQNMVGTFNAVGPAEECTLSATVLANGMNAAVSATGNGALEPVYSINWGDDSPLTNVSAATHIYLSEGSFDVCITYSDQADPDNCTVVYCETVTVQQQGDCSVVLTVEVVENVVTATAIGEGASSELYIISWGDGNTSFGSAAEYVYSATGSYDICVNYSDLMPNGCSAVDCETVIITGGGGTGGCTLNVTAIPLSGLSAGVAGTGNGALVEQYTIDWGDGSEVDFGQPGTHTYALEGTYQVCITYSDLSNKENCIVTECVNVTVTGIVSFCSVELTLVQDGATVTATAVGIGEAISPQYYIDWGDGSANTFSNTGTHTYLTTDSITICAYFADLTNVANCFATDCEDIFVTVNVGENSFNRNVMRVMPNPVSDISSIEIGMNTASLLRIEVLDIVGNCVQQVVAGNRSAGLHRIELNTTNYPSGFYFVRAILDGSEQTIKIIKQ